MNNTEFTKNYDWETFINEWGKQFEDAKNILRFLNSYPTIKRGIRVKELNTEVDLERTQKEWIWLTSKLVHPDDIDFFKPWWIMIEISSYDKFMDLSDPKYPILNTYFYPSIKPNWCKAVFFPDISEVLINIEDKEKIDEIREQGWVEHRNYMCRFEEEEDKDEEVNESLDKDSKDITDDDFDDDFHLEGEL